MTVIFQDNRSRTPKYFHLRQSIEGLKRNKRWKYLGMCGVFITFANMNEIKIMYARKAMLTAALLIMGQSAALALANDSVPAKKKAKVECCEDTTVTDHKDPYHKVVKEGGSMREGLFTVRHIKDDWYLEVPDTLLNRLMLAVTRFSSVPQGFKLLSGEEVNHSAIYLEQHGAKTLLMREYVRTAFAKEKDQISENLERSVADPIIYKFDVIGRNPKTQDQLINITKW